MKDFKIYLSVISALAVIYLVAQYNKPEPVNWSPTFYYKDKIPYGNFVAYNQLNKIFKGATIIKTNASLYKTFQDSAMMPGNYLVFSKEFKAGKADYSALIKYVSAGNSVFISSFSFSGVFADTLKITTNYEYQKKNAVLSFTNSGISQQLYKFNDDISNEYFQSFDTAKVTVLGKNNYGHSTFINLKFGKGNLYINCNPALFTNFSILTENGADYAAKALSYLPLAKNIYWDEFQNGDIPDDDSPLRVFFKNGSLQWAYYLGLFTLTIFILFEVKRRQRIIPVLAPLENATLSFVNVVGQVYYEKRDNANIAHKKILYLLEELRVKYNIKTNKLDEEFSERLSSKSGIKLLLAQQLITTIHQLDAQQHVTDTELIQLNKLIEQLYTQSR